MKLPGWLIWTVAFIVTAASAVYQRMTGPTYPVRGTITIADTAVRYRLPRARGGPGDCLIPIKNAARTLTGTVELRRYRSHDEWRSVPLERDGDDLIARIPHQPPAGKVMYRIHLAGPDGRGRALTADPVIIRFRGGVPAPILIAHVITIFGGMLTSTRAGFEALRRRPRHLRSYAAWTLGLLVIGGLILGPVVQKYAFGAYWTGWPFGHDLTDNKLAVAVLAWALALWRAARPIPGRRWVLGAAVVTLIVWLIPHSVLGSELDYTDAPPTLPTAAASQPVIPGPSAPES